MTTQPTITAADRAAREYTPAELKHRRIPGRRTEQCPACGELFAGTSVGDTHQYGPWADRRCLTRAETTARGMWTDERDVWHLKGGPRPAEITPPAALGRPPSPRVGTY